MDMLRCAITQRASMDGKDAAARRQALVWRCGELAREGIEFLLVREKDLLAGELAGLCREVIAAVQVTDMHVVVAGGRADVALAVGACGVHLSGSPGELTVSEARAVVGAKAFVSVACHSVQEVAGARRAGASAVLFSPVFGKQVGGAQAVEGLGVAALREACIAAGEMPVFALGGIQPGNAAACAAAGAAGVAGIRMFFGS